MINADSGPSVEDSDRDISRRIFMHPELSPLSHWLQPESEIGHRAMEFERSVELSIVLKTRALEALCLEDEQNIREFEDSNVLSAHYFLDDSWAAIIAFHPDEELLKDNSHKGIVDKLVELRDRIKEDNGDYIPAEFQLPGHIEIKLHRNTLRDDFHIVDLVFLGNFTKVFKEAEIDKHLDVTMDMALDDSFKVLPGDKIQEYIDLISQFKPIHLM